MTLPTESQSEFASTRYDQVGVAKSNIERRLNDLMSIVDRLGNTVTKLEDQVDTIATPVFNTTDERPLEKTSMEERTESHVAIILLETTDKLSALNTRINNLQDRMEI